MMQVEVCFGVWMAGILYIRKKYVDEHGKIYSSVCDLDVDIYGSRGRLQNDH